MLFPIRATPGIMDRVLPTLMKPRKETLLARATAPSRDAVEPGLTALFTESPEPSRAIDRMLAELPSVRASNTDIPPRPTRITAFERKQLSLYERCLAETYPILSRVTTFMACAFSIHVTVPRAVVSIVESAVCRPVESTHLSIKSWTGANDLATKSLPSITSPVTDKTKCGAELFSQKLKTHRSRQ